MLVKGVRKRKFKAIYRARGCSEEIIEALVIQREDRHAARLKRCEKRYKARLKKPKRTERQGIGGGLLRLFGFGSSGDLFEDRCEEYRKKNKIKKDAKISFNPRTGDFNVKYKTKQKEKNWLSKIFGKGGNR